MKKQFIAIEGPIGVGKSTLAEVLSTAENAHFLRDTENANPYLSGFYTQGSSMAFHTQMHFLMSRLQVLENPAVVKPVQPIVSDFMLAKDRLFAELTLDEQEWWMYSSIFDRMTADCPQPDFVIYLQAPLSRLIQRIEKRGIAEEARMDSHYLQQVIDQYEQFFHNYTSTPLLIVNAADINLVDNTADINALLSQIAGIEGGRHYYNPAATSA
jgi:deoxyadenosine/deoxycytidine kinase